ncbi:trimethylamine methyltransferase [Desulfitobacterium hafniense DP7]|uniref:Trimethylamine methyltransferase n=1 Tax=Desulfitobacterium hafniense DP7 TaxID=537010 RepID=G9XGQ6_DESHA|nr:trimethylamine methyltransferase family protein [Desulfitobacterium hafniense]EHL09091.1 trimethylamine methyltransferase [Desulfitobacterium hafniense DP7]
MSIEGIQSYYKENKTQYTVITEEECEKIIASALRILEKTGILVKTEEIRNLFQEHGCQVEGELVRIPADLVKSSIQSTPQEVVLYDRFGHEAIRVGGPSCHFGNGPTNPYFNDFETGERRKVLKSDVAQSARVSDALPNIDFVMSLAGITDWDPRIADVCEMHEMLQNTTKPLVAWGIDAAGLKDQFEMCAAVVGGWDKLVEKPLLAVYTGNPISPLLFAEDSLEKTRYCAEVGVPVLYPADGQLGSIKPVTLAGTVACGLAENFAALVLTQLINKGVPYIGGVCVSTVSMTTGGLAIGSPEHCLGDSIVADLFHYLNLPKWSTGGATDSKIVDEQSAIESSMTILTAVLSGAHLVHDVGFLDCAMSADLNQIVLGDEIISYARRIGRGVQVDEETLALDVIDEIGPGGEYLSHPHTFKHFKQELWRPTLLDRNNYQTWAEEKKDMRTRIREKTRHILETHKVPPLPADVTAKLDKILESAQQRLK